MKVDVRCPRLLTRALKLALTHIYYIDTHTLARARSRGMNEVEEDVGDESPYSKETERIRKTERERYKEQANVFACSNHTHYQTKLRKHILENNVYMPLKANV